MRTETVTCPTCAAPVDLDPSRMRQTCPYCDGMLGHALSSEAAGEATARLQAAMKPLDRKLRKARKALLDAVKRRDRAGIESAVEAEAKWTLQAYDDADYWRFLGLDDPKAVADYRRAHVRQNLQVWLGQIGEAPSPAASGAGPTPAVAGAEGAAVEWTYVEAMLKQDLDGLVGRFTREMDAHLRQTGGMGEGARRRMVRDALENLLREQPWVTPEDLDRLGFSRPSDAKRTEAGWAVRCQRCGVAQTVAEGTETLRCGHCDATTRIGLHGADRAAAFDRGRRKG